MRIMDVKIAVVGKRGTGKTSFVNALSTQSSNSSAGRKRPHPTVGSVFGKWKVERPEADVTIQCWDVAGSLHHSVSSKFTKWAQVSFVFYDISDQHSFDDACSTVGRIQQDYHDRSSTSRKPRFVVLVGTVSETNAKVVQREHIEIFKNQFHEAQVDGVSLRCWEIVPSLYNEELASIWIELLNEVVTESHQWSLDDSVTESPTHRSRRSSSGPMSRLRRLSLRGSLGTNSLSFAGVGLFNDEGRPMSAPARGSDGLRYSKLWRYSPRLSAAATTLVPESTQSPESRVRFRTSESMQPLVIANTDGHLRESNDGSQCGIPQNKSSDDYQLHDLSGKPECIDTVQIDTNEAKLQQDTEHGNTENIPTMSCTFVNIDKHEECTQTLPVVHDQTRMSADTTRNSDDINTTVHVTNNLHELSLRSARVGESDENSSLLQRITASMEPTTGVNNTSNVISPSPTRDVNRTDSWLTSSDILCDFGPSRQVATHVEVEHEPETDAQHDVVEEEKETAGDKVLFDSSTFELDVYNQIASEPVNLAREKDSNRSVVTQQGRLLRSMRLLNMVAKVNALLPLGKQNASHQTRRRSYSSGKRLLSTLKKRQSSPTVAIPRDFPLTQRRSRKWFSSRSTKVG